MEKVRIRIARTVPEPKERKTRSQGAAVALNPVIAAGALIGFGMAALLDVVLFRELLQWHTLLAERHPVEGVPAEQALQNLRTNLFWQGVYDLVGWLITVIGIGVLWGAGYRRDASWSTPSFLGAALLGWGVFAIIESLVAHFGLDLHHVRQDTDALGWDIAYLVLGVVLVAVGWIVIRADAQRR